MANNGNGGVQNLMCRGGGGGGGDTVWRKATKKNIRWGTVSGEKPGFRKKKGGGTQTLCDA